MRVTNSLMNSNTLRNYQSGHEKLYGINQQLASGLKIQNSYEDTNIYTNTMRLDAQLDTLEQASSSASLGQSFAKNTDSTLTDFTKVMNQFKTKLTQASNASNSTTSLEALANELKALETSMVNLANTSINGQYLFSGSAVSTKPVSDTGTYQGNGETLTAVVGSGVEMAYNIDGKSLFYGTDGEYSKTLSTNVKMYNQTKLNPTLMSGLPVGAVSKEEFLTSSDTIRDMVGDNDSNATNDSNAIFYLSGRKSSGETFSTKISMTTDAPISDLLDKIGQAYGNTSTSKLVDVEMNKNGQIEITDKNTGNKTLDMNLFAAIDRDPTNVAANEADQTNINNLLSVQNVDIIPFNASNYSTINSASTISSRADIYNAGSYKIGYPLQDSKGNNATASTLLTSIMPSNVSSISLNNGTPPPLSLAVTATTTVQDLMNSVATQTSGSVRIENGQMIVSSATPVNLTVTALDATSTATSAFSIPDGINYTQRGFEKSGSVLTGNASQVNKTTNEYAVASTKLSDVAGTTSLNGQSFTLNYVDKNGAKKSATLNLATAGSTFTVNGNTYNVFDSSGNATPADKVTYEQLNNVIGMLTSDSLPKAGVPSVTSTPFEQYNYAVQTAQSSVAVSLNDQGQMSITDKTTATSKIEFSMFDTNAATYPAAVGATNVGSSLSFMSNDSVTIENPTINFFSQLDDMIDSVRSGTYRMDSTSSDPRNPGMQNSLKVFDHLADHIAKQHTTIGAYSNALSDEKDRVDVLSVHVKTVQSDIIDVDEAQAYLELNSVYSSFQAMLSSISKMSKMSLVDYL